MKTKDHILRGTLASIAANGNGKITWKNNNETYFQVESNEGLELIMMGINPAANVEKTYVRNRDNTDWQPYGFITQNDARLNELPHTNMRDWSMIKARVSPDVSVFRPITLKMSTGDKFQVVLEAGSSAVTSSSSAYAVIRRHIADVKADQDVLAGYGTNFGGIESSGQAFHLNAKISSTTVNAWNDIINFDILKDELYSFNKLGVVTSDSHADIVKLMVDDEYEYNTYPHDMLPLVTGAVSVTFDYDPTGTAAVTGAQSDYGMIASEYLFSKPLVVSRTSNKNIKVQIKDDGTAISSNVWARLAGVRYKITG